ncbi:YheC/YheD family protein [Metabacillus halosaccharovorans]|uniref:YheC/YheD family endospore coat-associated protein n=1 Tax=Metabacillus halosaccharovorans TaxID=930124 RepID=UPI001C1FBAA9|nr:YheC/YheD family protein [Metabacillus halosaccharovorans]MBU7592261.1 YheC/YheD family protein [Metabacillus halosaccharovorans]
MTVIGMLHSRKNPGNVKKAYACAAVSKMEGVDFFYFSFGTVDMADNKINGWRYDNGKWIQQQRDLPDIIINSKSPKNDKQKQIWSYLKNKCLFTSNSVGSKLNVYQKIIEGKQFSHYVIPFFILTKGDEIFDHFEKHKKLVIKPIKGSGGKGIIFIEKITTNHFQIIYGNDNETLKKNELPLYLDHLLVTTRYIIQPFIKSTTKEGLVYDIRLHVQKNGKGEWETTLIYPRISANRKMISNISSGGFRGELQSFLIEEFGDEYYNMKRLLEHFSIRFSQHFESLYHHKFDELGIDIGIDANQKLWIYEVNWRPGSKHREMDVAKNQVEYAVYLAKANK